MFSFDFAPLLLSGTRTSLGTICRSPLCLPLGYLVTLHFFGLLLSCVWIGYWVKNVFIPFPDIRAIYNGTDKVYNPVHIAPTTTFQGIHNLTQFIFYIFGSLLIPLMGVICFFVILFNLNEDFGGIKSFNWVKATYKAIQGIIFSSLSAAFRVARTIRLVTWIKRPFRKLRKSFTQLFSYTTRLIRHFQSFFSSVSPSTYSFTHLVHY